MRPRALQTDTALLLVLVVFAFFFSSLLGEKRVIVVFSLPLIKKKRDGVLCSLVLHLLLHVAIFLWFLVFSPSLFREKKVMVLSLPLIKEKKGCCAFISLAFALTCCLFLVAFGLFPVTI